MSIIHLENNHSKINTLEEIEIQKQPPPNTYSMMSLQNKMTQCPNFSPHQGFKLQDEEPNQATKEISKPNS